MHRHRKSVYAFKTQLARDCILYSPLFFNQLFIDSLPIVTVQTIVKTDEI